MLHDTHAHLDLLLERLELITIPERKDPEVINQMEEMIPTKAQDMLQELLSGHELLIHPTVSTANFQFVHRNFSFLGKVSFLFGSHPEIVDPAFDLSSYGKQQKNLLHIPEYKNRLIGIGEVGLDYFYTQDLEIIQKQQFLFESQIQLAIDLDLPLVIHCRDAFDDLFSILKNFSKIHNHFLIHCFTGGIPELEQTLGMGGKVAYGGIVTFSSGKTLQATVPICPSDSYVLETDLPFLAPIPHRGQICLPKYIDAVAESVALLRDQEKEEIWQQSLSNTKTLFSLT